MKINLEQLLKLLGDESRAMRFVDIFKTQLPGELARLRQFLHEKDWENASIVAHGLKSQCRYLGLDEAADLLEKMEQSPENQPVADLERLLL